MVFNSRGHTFTTLKASVNLIAYAELSCREDHLAPRSPVAFTMVETNLNHQLMGWKRRIQ
jgi:hypothetical protein